MNVVQQIDQEAVKILEAHGFAQKIRAVARLFGVITSWARLGSRDGLAEHLKICSSDLSRIAEKMLGRPSMSEMNSRRSKR